MEPVRRELAQVEEELRRLARDWVRSALTEVEVDQLQRSALERREHLEARVEALGPGRIAELERTRAHLAAVEEELAGAESAPPPSPYRRKNFPAPLRDIKAGTQEKAQEGQEAKAQEAKGKEAQSPHAYCRRTDRSPAGI